MFLDEFVNFISLNWSNSETLLTGEGMMNITTSKYATEKEANARQQFINRFKECPMPEYELVRNLGLFINRIGLTRILFIQEMYSKIVGVHGDVMEFGCRWGQNLALFINFRGIMEPFNMSRKIIGFDTFQGFAGIDAKDKITAKSSLCANKGDYGVTENYDLYLKEILDYHVGECPAPQIRRHEIIKGDAPDEIEIYLKEHPETIIAFAYFDMDIYKPTQNCLKAIRPHLTKGSIIGFDELNSPDFPGETIAFQEILGANNFRIINSPYSAGSAYLIFE